MTQTHEIICAGFGGQGILFLGKMIALSGMKEGKEVSWIPSYGPEMRGGTANCSVVVSDQKIGSPVVYHPTILVAMNRPSMEKFENDVKPNGVLLYNKTLIEVEPKRKDIKIFPVNVTGIASELGNVKLANVVALGALIKATGLIKKDSAIAALKYELTGKKAALLDINFKALDAGEQAV